MDTCTSAHAQYTALDHCQPSQLPFTGAHLALWLVVAVLLVIAGYGLVQLSKVLR